MPTKNQKETIDHFQRFSPDPPPNHPRRAQILNSKRNINLLEQVSRLFTAKRCLFVAPYVRPHPGNWAQSSFTGNQGIACVEGPSSNITYWCVLLSHGYVFPRRHDAYNCNGNIPSPTSIYFIHALIVVSVSDLYVKKYT